MSWVAVGAVAAVSAAAISGYSAYSTNKTAQEQAQADADATAARGRLEAERILKQKEKQQSTAKASAAENGLDVNEGTAIKINDEIENAGQYDAEIAKQTGYNASQRLQAQASQYGANATTALASGVLNTTTSAVNGYTSYKKGWK
ncbi:hypothetical protein [Acinetobacter pollinis]|uniref:Phage protein n=1 Tax=Acinetobacter pollinis TaxID=2605270 RepID=A0ABU6DTU3_9GAMM|nr:hypothetical protein [Acinetobacter pollinis]MEB5477270.1 hypothetical protein [Acinetobacter pollinis]